MKWLTFPARPLSGGPFKSTLQKPGQWWAEPKYNGWRAQVHVPTASMFNRHGQRLSIEGSFGVALDMLQRRFGDYEWVDCEAMERRHVKAKGSLIVLDLIVPKVPYEDRKAVIAQRAPILHIAGDPKQNQLYAAPASRNAASIWDQCLQRNKTLPDFYEGIVMKRAGSFYPISPLRQRDTTEWVKHRWTY